MTTRLPIDPCVECGKPLDAATFLMDDKVKPNPGDISICFYCGHMTVFTDDMHRRELTPEEIHDIAGDPIMLQLQRARGEFMQDK
jgi:hypothetical protein